MELFYHLAVITLSVIVITFNLNNSVLELLLTCAPVCAALWLNCCPLDLIPFFVSSQQWGVRVRPPKECFVSAWTPRGQGASHSLHTLIHTYTKERETERAEQTTLRDNPAVALNMNEEKTRQQVWSLCSFTLLVLSVAAGMTVLVIHCTFKSTKYC